MKRVFIIHGWGGHSQEGWLAWLGGELRSRGFEVGIPDMPDTNNPRIEPWLSQLTELVGIADRHTYFVGHSIGCQAILRYAASLNTSIGGMVLIAPWVRLPNIREEEKEIAQPWLEMPIDFSAAQSHGGKAIAIFSDDDEDAPVEDAPLFEQQLGARTIILPGRGHFTEGDGAWQLPEALDAIIGISS